MIEIPPLLTPSQVGCSLRVSRRSAKAMLRAAGILERHANGRWYVGESRLRERLPDVYDRVYAFFMLAPSSAPRSGR